MICPICKNETEELYSSVSRGEYVSERCKSCAWVAMNQAYADYARKYERDWQKREYAKDIIQRWDGGKPNPEFIQAYPNEARKQWGDSVLRDHGVKNRLL